METPSKFADENTQLQWKGLPELVIHRFQDQEEVLEVHRCRKPHAQSSQHFWIQSVLNRLDFTEAPGFFAAFVTDAVRRATTVSDVMATYDSFRRDNASVFPPRETLAAAIVMCEVVDEYCALLESPEDYYAIHWSNSA